MNQKINQYIQQQIAAAVSEKQRRDTEALLKQQQEIAERNAKSVANTIRALGLLGIEAGESDLLFDESWGFCLPFNNTIRLSLQTDNMSNWLSDKHYRDNTKPYEVFGVLIVSRVIPDEYRNEEGELLRGFSWSRYICQHRIDIRSKEPITRLDDNEIFEIFSSITELEKTFWEDEKAYLAARDQQQSKESASPKALITYSGNSREAILSQLLRDIANPPKLECGYCGRQAVDPVDNYCGRCGTDQGDI